LDQIRLSGQLWTEDFKRILNHNRINAFMAKLSTVGIQMLSDIEKFSVKLRGDIETAVSVPMASDDNRHVDARLVFTPIDADALPEEFYRVL
jgi:hypothetical protein